MDNRLYDSIEQLCKAGEKLASTCKRQSAIIMALAAMFGLCLFYVLYQNFNYNGYPKQEVNNTNNLIGGNANVLEQRTETTTPTKATTGKQ